MAADALTFQLELIDKLTAPAAEIDKALKAIEDTLTRLKSLVPVIKDLKLPATVRLPKIIEPQSEAAKPKGTAGRETDRAAKAAKANVEALVHENAKLGPSLIAPLQLSNKELEALKQNLRDDKLAVTNLTAALKQMEQATVVDLQAVRLLKAQIQEKKNALAATQRQLVLSGNAARFGSEGTNRLTTTLRELAEKAGVIPGTLGGLSQKLGGVVGQADDLVAALGPAGASVAALGAASVAAIAGVVALGAALAYAAVKGGALAISAVDAKSDTLDMLEAFLGTEEAALSTYDTIKDLTRNVGISMASAQGLAQSLTAAGIENQAMLEDSLKAIATADAIVKGAGGKIQSLIERATTSGKFEINAKKLTGTGIQVRALYEQIAADTGKGIKQVEAELKAGKISAEVGIAALTKTVDKKFGNIARNRARGFEESMVRLKDNLTKLFDGVNIEGFEGSLARIVDLFDESTVNGAALKQVLTGIFDGMFAAIERVEPYVTIFLKTLTLTALKVYNAFRPLMHQLGIIGKEGASDHTALIDRMISLANAIGTAATVAAKLAEALVAIAKIDFKIISAVLNPSGLGEDLANKLLEQGRAQGGAAGQGLKQGLEAQKPGLMATMSALGTGMIAQFKKTFDIHSPSRVMAKLGGNLSLGLSAGIEAKASAPERSMAEVIDFPRLPPPVPAPRTRERDVAPKGGMTITFSEGAIQINGVENAEQLRDLFPEMFANAFQRLALQAAG